jgi:hypothetical protein
MNKISFKFAHEALTGSALAEATYLNNLITKRPLNRLMVPLQLASNTPEDVINLNQTSHLVASQKIQAGQPVFKMASEDFVWTGRLNPYLNQHTHTIHEKMENLKLRIIGEAASRRNQARLDTLLRWLIDYFSVRQSNDTAETPGLQLTATHLRNVCQRPSFLDLPDETIKSLLICDEDVQRYSVYKRLYDGIATEFHKVFPGVEKSLIVPAMVALRANHLVYPGIPPDCLDERLSHHSNPLKTILRPSFQPNTIVDPFFDFTIPGEFIVLVANRDIEAGETLSVNCEEKSGFTRQL